MGIRGRVSKGEGKERNGGRTTIIKLYVCPKSFTCVFSCSYFVGEVCGCSDDGTH